MKIVNVEKMRIKNTKRGCGRLNWRIEGVNGETTVMYNAKRGFGGLI